jgi:hypothetical protein
MAQCGYIFQQLVSLGGSTIAGIPYYSGNDIYIMLPGRSAISMGTANPGDRFGVQLSNNNIAFTKAVAGSNTWQIMYIADDLTPEVINNSTQFRARVAGFSQIYRAYVGASCQMAVIPSATPIPTGPVGATLHRGTLN